MNLDDQFDLEHLFLKERVCRICGEEKNLIDEFYLTRKNRGGNASSYSYECKLCTIKRISKTRKKKVIVWEYPDW